MNKEAEALVLAADAAEAGDDALVGVEHPGPDRDPRRTGPGQAQTLVGLEPKPGRGWHSLRRKFATDLMDLPLKVLCELGGWKSPQTVLRCYQQADARTAWEGAGESPEGSHLRSQSEGVKRRESGRRIP